MDDIAKMLLINVRLLSLSPPPSTILSPPLTTSPLLPLRQRRLDFLIPSVHHLLRRNPLGLYLLLSILTLLLLARPAKMLQPDLEEVAQQVNAELHPAVGRHHLPEGLQSLTLRDIQSPDPVSRSPLSTGGPRSLLRTSRPVRGEERGLMGGMTSDPIFLRRRRTISPTVPLGSSSAPVKLRKQHELGSNKQDTSVSTPAREGGLTRSAPVRVREGLNPILPMSSPRPQNRDHTVIQIQQLAQQHHQLTPTRPSLEVTSDQDPEPPHETEIVLGLVGGTGGVPRSAEISAPILGQWLQVGNKLEVSDLDVSDFTKHPLQISVALLVASMLLIFWETSCIHIRCSIIRKFEAILCPSTITKQTSLYIRAWHHCILMLLYSLTSGGLIWVLVFSICTNTSRPMLLFKCQVALIIHLSLLLAARLNDTLAELWHRLRGRHGRHESFGMELPRREPPQFHHDPPSPPTHFN